MRRPTFSRSRVNLSWILWIGLVGHGGVHPCSREWPLPKPAEAKLNGSAWLGRALGLPAFLAGKMKDEEVKTKKEEEGIKFLSSILSS